MMREIFSTVVVPRQSAPPNDASRTAYLLLGEAIPVTLMAPYPSSYHRLGIALAIISTSKAEEDVELQAADAALPHDIETRALAIAEQILDDEHRVDVGNISGRAKILLLKDIRALAAGGNLGTPRLAKIKRIAERHRSMIEARRSLWPADRTERLVGVIAAEVVCDDGLTRWERRLVDRMAEHMLGRPLELAELLCISE